jgi:cytochrome o ubiquinol oxidase subunit 2
MQAIKYFFRAGLFTLGALILLGGCSTILLFNPKGPIGDTQRFVIIAAIVLMAIVVIPVYIMNFWFARKYRASNTSAPYQPDWHYNLKIDLFMWGIPIVIVALLAILAWTTTHALDPYKPIKSDSGDSINIEAVALQWKWLFIYPDHNIATVNEIAFPVNVPVSFKITSNNVMCSFFIPQLGSQIYAMGGMRTELHLMANEPGVYGGHNQQFNGRDYSDMYFKAHAVAPEEFQTWVRKAKSSPQKLDPGRYAELAKASDGHHPVVYYSWVQPNLFVDILREFNPMWGEMSGSMSGGMAPAPAAGTGGAEEK